MFTGWCVMINRDQFIRALDGSESILQAADELGVSEKYVFKLIQKFNIKYKITVTRKIRVTGIL
jgi:molybdenum-dependent DNA-binding transcriptional regulator ModE